MSKKRIFVSDIHMGAGRRPSRGRYSYDWLEQRDADNLAAFLSSLHEKSNDIDEVILLGDVMDTWVCPHFDTPPSFSDILENPINKGIVDELVNLTDKVKVKYVPGNHDMGVSMDDLKNLELNMSNFEIIDKYDKDGVWAEHGHEYDSYNKKNGGMRPFGYFISRLSATRCAMRGSDRRHWWEYRDCLGPILGKIIGNDNIGKAILNAFVEDTGVSSTEEFKMPHGESPVKVGDVINTYANTRLYYENINLAWAGKQKAEKLDKSQIIIFGHSHIKILEEFPKNENPPFDMYVNCGTWCDRGKGYTFTEVFDDNNSRIVNLKRWDDHEQHRLDGSFIYLKEF